MCCPSSRIHSSRVSALRSNNCCELKSSRFVSRIPDSRNLFLFNSFPKTDCCSSKFSYIPNYYPYFSYRY